MNYRDVLDWVWPTIEPPKEGWEAYKKRISLRTLSRVPAWSDDEKRTGADRFCAEVAQEMKAESERQQRALERLNWYLRFASAGVLMSALANVVGILLALKYTELTSLSVIGGAIVMLYIMVQMIGIMDAGWKGLRVEVVLAREALPVDPNAPPYVSDFNRCATDLWHTAEQCERTNRRLSQILRCEASVRNLKLGLALFGVFSIFVLGWNLLA